MDDLRNVQLLLEEKTVLLEDANKFQRELMDQNEHVEAMLQDKMNSVQDMETELSEYHRRVELKEEQIKHLKQEAELLQLSVEEKVQTRTERIERDLVRQQEARIANIEDDKMELKCEIEKMQEIERVLRRDNKSNGDQLMQLQEELITRNTVEKDLKDRDAELVKYSRQITDLSKQYKLVQEELIKHVHHNKQLTEKKRRVEEEGEYLQCANSSLQNQVEAHKDEVARLKMEVELANTQLNTQQGVDQGNSLFAEVDDRRRILERQNRQYKAKCQTLEENYKRVVQSRDSLKRQLLTMSVHSKDHLVHKERIEQLRAELSHFQSEVKDLNKSVFSSEGKITDLQNQIDCDHYPSFNGCEVGSDIYTLKRLELQCKKQKEELERTIKEKKKNKFNELFARDHIFKLEDELYNEKKTNNAQNTALVRLQLKHEDLEMKLKLAEEKLAILFKEDFKTPKSNKKSNKTPALRAEPRPNDFLFQSPSKPGSFALPVEPDKENISPNREQGEFTTLNVTNREQGELTTLNVNKGNREQGELTTLNVTNSGQGEFTTLNVTKREPLSQDVELTTRISRW